MDMLNAVKSTLADVGPSAYSHQPYIDTLCIYFSWLDVTVVVVYFMTVCLFSRSPSYRGG